tara:strand:- start:499 stop:876 length:378 start_codon:yes stop_codon:yes gene_type:complete
MYAVSNDRSDTVTAHFSGRVGDDPMLIVEGDAEASVGQDLVDRAFHRDELFLRQTISLAYDNSSARTYSGAEPRCVKWKRCCANICVRIGNQNPSQATLGNFDIAQWTKISIKIAAADIIGNHSR